MLFFFSTHSENHLKNYETQWSRPDGFFLQNEIQSRYKVATRRSERGLRGANSDPDISGALIGDRRVIDVDTDDDETDHHHADDA